MDPDGSFGMGGFLQGMLGDLLKMVHTDAPIQWEMANQFAQSIASDGATDANPDPLERIRLEQLLHIAELHVADVTGMTVTPGGKQISISTTGRAAWAQQSLDNWRPIIERIASALKDSGETEADTPDGNALQDLQQGGFEELIAKWATAISPMMLAMQIGSVVGHLARRALSQFELLLPKNNIHSIAFVGENLRRFAEDWSLPAEDLALWVVARDVTISSILSRPHVTDRLSDLLVRHAAGFRTDPSALEHHFSEFSSAGLNDFSDLSKLLGDPTALRALAETPELARINAELAALSSTIEGYTEWVTATVVERVSGNAIRVREAMRRHRVEQGEEARTADLLFGLTTDQRALDRGEAFVRGVIDRHGEQELARLWVVESDLPTPSEVEAPGLWIERVNLPQD